MAYKYFGHGRWGAPYWFIGPEPGQGRDEHSRLDLRTKAWRELGGGELNDCREFHAYIKQFQWHEGKPRLQPTWRPLILLLLTFLIGDREVIDNDRLRIYQRDDWGSEHGETCVIELSALAANSLNVSRDRVSPLESRIALIRDRIRTYRPRLVLMYGKRQRESWEAIRGDALPGSQTISVSGCTIFVQTPHPVSGLRNAHWVALGTELRTKADRINQQSRHSNRDKLDDR
jgi:hypothetical protein